MNETSPSSSPSLTRNVFRAFGATMVLHALAAYALGPVPLPWIAQIAAIYLFFWIGLKSGLRMAPGMVLFAFFFIYAAVVTAYQSIIGEYYNYMPALATTPYLYYIALRFMTMASFGSLVYVTYWFLIRGYKPKLIKFMAWLCLIFSAAALYIYLAQIYGWPEPPRTRMGTGGGEQSTVFTYAFHRAMGTFREPSHLAEWLVVPLFMSFAGEGLFFFVARGAGVLTLLLTGSLTGIAALLSGMAAGFVLLLPFLSLRVVKSVVGMVIMGMLGLSAFSIVVSTKNRNGADLIEILTSRVKPLQEKGMSQSNRNYVYNYLAAKDVPWFGEGLGNSNLAFTQAVGLDATASFLNLFINIELSLGYVGLALFIIFMAVPAIILFSNRRYKFESDHYFIFSAFCGWIVVFFAHSEELSFHFAIIYALLIHAFTQQKPQKRVVAPTRAVAA